MLDVDGELPYTVWFQCKRCTHLFYNEEAKIVAHLKEKHGFGLPKVQVPSPRFKSSPLKIKEQHFRPAVSVPSTSSGTDGDGEDTYAEDIMNNNNNYATKLPVPKRMPKLYYKDDINHVQNAAINRINANIPRRIIPSIEELKKQLVNSEIDISEIKMGSCIPTKEEEEEECEVEEEQENEDMRAEDVEFQEVYPEEGYNEENMEDPELEEEQSEDVEEEGASTSNQSFYENDIGEHFLFKTDGDSESNYEDDGIMTPSFGMVDELYANMTAGSASSSEQSTSQRRRTFHNPCKLCKKVFPSLSMLKKHAKTHLNEDGGSQHICKFCFDYFSSASGLSKHLNVCSVSVLNPNVCTVCAKSFTSWATLRTHMKIHSGERPFACNTCGQRFQTKSTLDSHLRIHANIRPHICSICHKSFRTSSPLYRHMRSVHKGLSMTVGAVTVNS